MNTTHLHLLLNHVPVLGVVCALALLAYGFWRKSNELKRAACILFVVASLVGVPTYLTGEPAEEAVEGLPGVSEAIVEKHEEIAAIAFGGVVLLGASSLVALVVFRRRQTFPAWASAPVLILAILTTGVLGWTANLGGKIRHTEIRSGADAPQVEKEYSSIEGRNEAR